MRGLINDFLIGADPEFVVFGSNGMLKIDGYLPHDGPVGWDHAGWVVEVRPKPAKGSYMLLKQIQTLLNGNWHVNIQLTRLRAGGYVNTKVASRPIASLGGHIHIDKNPYKIAGGYAAGYSNEHLLRVAALDAVTTYLENLDILPKKESEDRRNTTEYGKYGDVRAQRHVEGTGLDAKYVYHTEYRTMCSWLFDPKVAMICLTAAKLAAADPQGTTADLTKAKLSFENLKAWFEKYQAKDANAYRVVKRLLGGNLKDIQIDPTEDFRGKWATLPC